MDNFSIVSEEDFETSRNYQKKVSLKLFFCTSRNHISQHQLKVLQSISETKSTIFTTNSSKCYPGQGRLFLQHHSNFFCSKSDEKNLFFSVKVPTKCSPGQKAFSFESTNLKKVCSNAKKTFCNFSQKTFPPICFSVLDTQKSVLTTALWKFLLNVNNKVDWGFTTNFPSVSQSCILQYTTARSLFQSSPAQLCFASKFL